MTFSAASRPLYSHTQLSRYFDHIRLPHRYRTLKPTQAKTRDGLAFLNRLQRYQLASVPWENLSKHYSASLVPVTAQLGAEELYKKVVGRRGGGCLENNAFMGTVLRSLGFDCYPGGGRVHMGGGEWTGWEHMVNFVMIEGQKYKIDVGFGLNGPIQAVPLEENHIQRNIDPSSILLIQSHIAPQTEPAQKLWLYQSRVNDHGDWNDVYCFAETEFIPQDFESMTVSTSFRRNSFFSFSIAMCRMIMAGEVGDSSVEEDELIGTVMLTTKEAKVRIRGKVVEQVEFESEADRLNALRKYFGIGFGEVEKNNVKGTAVTLQT
ncbi:arylamine N-acetyltransferase 1 [Cryomyces antarcticus]